MCIVLLHDRFSKFFNNLLENITQYPDPESSDVHQLIRESLMDFLIDNSDLLPDYYTSEDQLPNL